MAGALFAAGAHAIPVPLNGNITISGAATMDNPNLSLANAVTAWSNTRVESADGDFLPFVGVNDPVLLTAPWTFNPSTATPALWSVDGFSFDLSAVTSVIRFTFAGIKFLTVTGIGDASGHGFGPTPGTWSFSTQSPSAGGKFSFSAATD